MKKTRPGSSWAAMYAMFPAGSQPSDIAKFLHEATVEIAYLTRTKFVCMASLEMLHARRLEFAHRLIQADAGAPA